MENYQSLKDIVYNYISDKITSGALKPNESINEAAICAELDISRTPVREALMKLSVEGFIEYVPRRGFFTQKLTLERVQGIYEIIGTLEALAAALALKHPQRLDVNELNRLVSEMDQAIESRRYDLYNALQFRFHAVILRASGNEDLTRLVNNLKKTFMRQEYLYQSCGYDIHEMVRAMNAEHRQMIARIEAGDVEGLKTLLADAHWNIKFAAYFTYE